ncbi:hypothetical protein JYT19_01170 [Sulfobacillus acidophilus]|uniref:Lipoprotein n=1 Tax=Sulfobacillus acidophilus TaxID=53633 RepID=A0ABS3AVZ1_9FIRM|nr:hypothetical protein [Sulfobacillus acidophilus]
MKKLSICVFSALALMMLSGCFTHYIKTGKGGNAVQSDDMELYFVAGLAGDVKTYVDDICESSKHTTVKVGRTFVDLLINLLSGLILSPQHVTVICEEY